jgi:PTS system nitrogen regulatory IIA component
MFDGPGQPWVEAPASAQTLEADVRFLTNWLVQNGQLPAHELEPVVARILRREQLGSSGGIGRGAAIPHTNSTALNAPVLVAGRLAAPVDWAAVDERPVRIVVLLVSPAANRGVALQALETVARRLREISESGG